MENRRLREEPSELPRVALALATLSLVGFSLVLLCQMYWLDAALRNEFAEHNTLGVRGRLVLLLSLAAGMALPALAGGLVLLRRNDRDAPLILERVATLSAPLAALFIVPGLFLSQLAQDKPLFYLVVLAGFGIVLQPLLAGALARVEGRAPGRMNRFFSQRALLQKLKSRSITRALPPFLALLCAGAYAFVLGRSAVVHHRLIQTTTSDLGIAENVLSNLLHQHRFRAPAHFGTAPGNYLTVHAEYGSLLFLPLYALRPSAETLLWLQASVAALAVLPLYLVAARKLGGPFALWISLAYLLAAPQHAALLTTFSWLPATTLFTFTLFYALESRRPWLTWLAFAALLSISEAGPLNALGVGLMLLLSRKQTRLGLLFSLLAVALIALNLVLAVRGSGAQPEPPLLTSVVALCRNPVYFAWDLARAVKLTWVMHALAPLCLLPLGEFVGWPLLVAGVMYASAGSTFWPNASGYATASVWLPGCFLGLLLALERRHDQGRRRHAYWATLVAVSITVSSHSYNFGALLRADSFGGASASLFRMTPWAQSRYDELRKITALIPPSASVAATTFLVPHVSSRPDVYDASRPFGAPDYILLSSREASFARESLSAGFAHHAYRLVQARFDEFYLFARGPETPETQAALSRLGLATAGP